MSTNYECHSPNYSSEDVHNCEAELIIKSVKDPKILLYNVENKLNAWRKETTCKNCGIIYENFLTLLDHSCKPFRCDLCSTAFLYDFRLNMHKCSAQKTTDELHDESAYSCNSCDSSFLELDSFLQHRSVCTHKQIKQCNLCKKQLHHKCQSLLCGDCTSSVSALKESRNNSTLMKQVYEQISSELTKFNSIHSACSSDDEADFSDRSSNLSLELSTKRSVDGSRKISKSLNEEKQLLNNCTFTSLRAKRKRKLVCCEDETTMHSKGNVHTDSSVSSQDTISSKKRLKSGISDPLDISSVSQKTVEHESSVKKKRSSSSTSTNKNSYKINNCKSGGPEKFQNVVSSTDTKNSSVKRKKEMARKNSYIKTNNCKTDGLEKFQNAISPTDAKNSSMKNKKEMPSKRTNSRVPSVESPVAASEALSNSSEETNISAVSLRPHDSLNHLKSKSVSSKNRNSRSSLDSYVVPKLEISSSTLNSDHMISALQLLSSDREQGRNVLRRKSDTVPNADKNQIKLKDLLNALPEKSGVLLRISSKNSNNFKCLKCSKSFKAVKPASIHYRDCGPPRTKKQQLVSLDTIEWVCLPCHFHCSRMSDLSTHKQLCSESSKQLCSESSNVTIKNWIFSYPHTCPKCGYKYKTSSKFSEHPCEKNLNDMQCYIAIPKLSECDLRRVKYEYAKEHTKSHNSDETLNYAKLCICKGKSCLKTKIKNIIENSSVSTTTDVSKSWLEPISNMFADMDPVSNSLLPDLNLDVIVPFREEILLSAIAEKFLTEKTEKLDKFDQDAMCEAGISPKNLMPEANSSSQCKSSTSDFSELNLNETSSQNTENTLSILKKFRCDCPRQQFLPDGEKKPCLPCLNKFIMEINLSSKCDETSNSNSSVPGMSDTPTSTVSKSDSTILLQLNCNNDNSVALVSQNVALDISQTSVNSAHYVSVSKHTDSSDLAKDTSSRPVLDNVIALGSNQIDINNDIPQDEFDDNLSDFSDTTCSGSFTLDDEIEFSDTDSASVPEIIHHYLQEIKEVSKEEKEKYFDFILTEYFLTGTHLEEGTLMVSSVSISKQSFAVSKYSSDHHVNLLNYIARLRGKVIDDLELTNPHEMRPCTSDSFSRDLPLELEVDCSFEHLILVLMKIPPCDLDVVFYFKPYLIHVRWQYELGKAYIGYAVKPRDEHPECYYICGICNKSIALQHMIIHAIEKHHDIKEYYILIL